MRTILACLLSLFLSVPAMAGTPTALGSGQYLTTVPKQCGGTLYCWGVNWYGTVGDGTINDRFTPTPVKLPSGVSAFKSVVTGGSMFAEATCALDYKGKAYCWGGNQRGELGNGTQGNSTNVNPFPEPTPVHMPAGVSAFTTISLGGYMGQTTTCALDTAGKAYCWGLSVNGAVGNGIPSSPAYGIYTEPQPVVMPTDVTFKKIQVGTNGGTVCAIGSDGRVYCWGSNQNGSLGINHFESHTEDHSAPVSVVMPSGVRAFTDIGVNAFTNCAIADTGKAYCWGDNGGGQIGDGTRERRSVPTPVTMPSGVSAFKSIAVGGMINTYAPYSPPTFGATTCAIADNGKAYCWGDNRGGTVGNGKKEDAVTTPTEVAFPAGVSTFSSITVNGYTACAVGDNHKAYCWGREIYGSMDELNKYQALPPTEVNLPAGKTSFISITRRHVGACAFVE